MAEKRATPRRGNCGGVKGGSEGTSRIVPDFERGCTWAGWLFAAMFAFMSAGAVVFGWWGAS